VLQGLPPECLAQPSQAPPLPVRQPEPPLPEPLQERRVFRPLVLNHLGLMLSQPNGDPRSQKLQRQRHRSCLPKSSPPPASGPCTRRDLVCKAHQHRPQDHGLTHIFPDPVLGQDGVYLAQEWSRAKGMAIRLPNGNTLGNFGEGGVIRELTPDQKTVFYVKFAVATGTDCFNKMVCNNVFVEDLYSLNGGGPKERTAVEDSKGHQGCFSSMPVVAGAGADVVAEVG
jgi:hypothetical protein